MSPATTGLPKDRRERILDVFGDLGCNVLYYDRKEDKDVPLNTIEEAIIAGEVTIDELLAPLRGDIEAAVRDLDQNKRVPR